REAPGESGQAVGGDRGCARRRALQGGCAGDRRRGALSRRKAGRAEDGFDPSCRRARSPRETAMSNREVVVVSGARTAIGAYGGALKDMPATALGAVAIREAVARAKVDPASVAHVVMGSVIHGEPKDMYLSRVAAV